MKSARRRAWTHAGALAALVFLSISLVGSGGCAGGPPPVFDRPPAIGGHLLLLAPQLRLGGARLEVAAEDLGELLDKLLREGFSGRGVSLAREEPAIVDALRQRLTAAWAQHRGSSSRRWRRGAILDLGEASRARGAASVAFAVLSVSGESSDRGLPLPPDEMIPLPDERADYELLRPGSAGSATTLELDLILVDLPTGVLRLHRRVAYPLMRPGQWVDALETLVREATRGLQPRHS
ncbi:MAG: hypothetical protein Q9Q40_07330 [Acidobacteriota bacterium]|nr:hypothetical protein [Acidobacteriota bacterium]